MARRSSAVLVSYTQTPAVLSALVVVSFLLMRQVLEMQKENQFVSQSGRFQSVVSGAIALGPGVKHCIMVEKARG